MGVRLGHQASRAGANNAQSVKSTPPAMRERAVRTTLHFLHVPDQVGFPPIMNADASLGSWRTANPSALVAMNLFEADKFALVREAGATKQISR